jgi:hypothetical protein
MKRRQPMQRKFPMDTKTIIAMKKLLLFFIISTTAITAIAQKQNFGILNFTEPANFQLDRKDNVLTYYNQNKNTGAYCLFFIYNIQNGKGDVQQDFNSAWEKLVQQPNNIKTTAVMQPQAILKGWQFLIGNTNFEDKGVATVAMLCTFSGNNQSQAVLIMSNSSAYKTDIENFIASVDIKKEISASTQNTNQTKSVNVAGDKSAYSILIPPSWSLNAAGNNLLLEKNTSVGKRTIEFMNMIKSSGDLEKDMAHIFFEVFDGWELHHTDASLFSEASHEKGLTCQGLNYYMISNSIKKKGPQSFDVIKATVLLIQVGDKVAIINTTDNILGSETENAMNFLLFKLKIKGITGKNIDYKKQLIGTWGTSNGSYGNSLNAVTSYAEGGNYYVLLESSYTTGYSYYYDLIKKKQFKSQGVFSFNKNVLERKVSSGTTNKNFIRFFSTKYGDREWENKMGLYDVDYDKNKISNLSYFHKIN